jgi:hypothetical protein
MKLSKSTSILINVALVLLIAILVKSIIAVPQSASAAPAKQYYVRYINAGVPSNLEAFIAEVVQLYGGTLDHVVSDGKVIYLIFAK